MQASIFPLIYGKCWFRHVCGESAKIPFRRPAVALAPEAPCPSQAPVLGVAPEHLVLVRAGAQLLQLLPHALEVGGGGTAVALQGGPVVGATLAGLGGPPVESKAGGGWPVAGGGVGGGGSGGGPSGGPRRCWGLGERWWRTQRRRGRGGPRTLPVLGAQLQVDGGLRACTLLYIYILVLACNRSVIIKLAACGSSRAAICTCAYKYCMRPRPKCATSLNCLPHAAEAARL